MGQYSYFLFARPSFSEGAGRIMDFGNTLSEYNRTENPDFNAFLADWSAIGFDLESAITDYREHQANPKITRSPARTR